MTASPDLAAHDDDGNGWIDEADPVFGPARRTPEADGRRGWQSRRGRRVLPAHAEFRTLKDGGTLGATRSSGVYLSEVGQGSLQQVDVIV